MFFLLSLSFFTSSFSYLLSLTILSPYSSYCACGHSPWVFALPGLILLLPVISFCLLLINASCAAALLSFVLGQHLLLTLSFSLAMSPPRFLLAPFPNLLSSVYLSSFSCLHPDISSDTRLPRLPSFVVRSQLPGANYSQ